MGGGGTEAANRKALWQTDEHETYARTQSSQRWWWRRGWRRRRQYPQPWRRHSAQSEPCLRQQRTGSADTRNLAAAVREISSAWPGRDGLWRPGDGGKLLSARGALFPHPERHEPGR